MNNNIKKKTSLKQKKEENDITSQHIDEKLLC